MSQVNSKRTYGQAEEGKHALVEVLWCSQEWAGQTGSGEAVFYKPPQFSKQLSLIHI